MHTCTHTHTHMHTCTHTHTHTCTLVHTHTHMHTCTHTHTQALVHTHTHTGTCTHTHTQALVHTHTHTHTGTCTHTHRHLYTHTHTHRHLYTHTHTQALVHTHTHTGTCTHTHTQALVHTHTHTGTCTHTHTQALVHTHTHTHTGTCTHTHTHRHLHAWAFQLYKAKYTQLKTGCKQRLEMDEDSSTEQKTWHVYSFGKRNVFRLHLNKSSEGFSESFFFSFLFPYRFSSSLCCWRTPSTHLCPLNFCPPTLPEAVTVNPDPSPARLWQWRCRTQRTAPRTTGRWRSSGTHSWVCCHGCGCEVCVSLGQSPCFCSCLRVGSSCHSLPVSHCQFNPFAGLGSVCRFCTGSKETNEV